jgi:YaiO family outer membrane protein
MNYRRNSIRRTTWTCLVLLALLLPMSAFGQDPEEELKEAELAVKAKNFSEAREIYRRLSLKHPETLEYLIWIGRLSRWMGDLPAATQAFDQALVLAPQNVEALVEKASVLMSQRDFSAARESLARANRVAPDSTDVQLAWGRYYHYQEKDREAREYVQRVLAREPGNKDAQELKSQLVLPQPVEVRIGYVHDNFSFAFPGNMGYLSVGYIGDRWRLAGRYERWRRFAENVNRGGFAVSRQLRKRLTLRGGVMWAPGATVLPRQDYTGGMSYAASPWVLGADYRHLRFTSANVHILSPSFEYYFKKPFWLTGTLYGSRTELKPSGIVDYKATFLARYFHQVSPHWILNAGYARGSEVLSDLSIDRLGEFRSNTYIGGVAWKPSHSITFDSYYAYQNRSNGSHVQSLGLSLTLRKSN